MREHTYTYIRKLEPQIIMLKEELRDVKQYITRPKFKQGDIVEIDNKDCNNKYRVNCVVCYDLSYPIYNLININNEEDLETILEVDIIKGDT